MSSRSRLRAIPAVFLVAGLAGVATALPASAATYTVNTTIDTADANVGDGICADLVEACSLRAAIQEANAGAEASVIELTPGATYLLTLSGAGEGAAATGDIDVTGDLTVRSSGAPATIDAAVGFGDRIFDVASGARLAVSSMTLQNGTAVDGALASGGAILNAGTVETTDVVIASSTANRAGGGIEASAGSTTSLLRTTLRDNVTGTSPGNGGGFHLTGAGTVTVTDSTVTGNLAANEGGGLWNSSAGTMTVTNTVVRGNEAKGAAATAGGGGIFNQPNAEATSGGTLTVTASTITDNHATGASGSGGGVFNSRGGATISDTVISANTAVRAGGGVEALAGTTTLTDVELVDNTTGATPGNGGGFHLTGPGTVTIDGSTVTGNVAANEGGGLWNSMTGTMTVTDTVVQDNAADGNGGGGLFNQGGVLDATNVALTGNTAPRGGGVLDINDGATTLTHVTVTENSAPIGAGVAVDGNTVTLANSIVAANAGGDDCTPTGVVSAGGNAVGTCDINDPSDVTGVADPMLDAELVPLGGSAAIDIGLDANCTPTDLAGRPRPVDFDRDGVARCDAGALEAQGRTAPGPIDPGPVVPEPTVPEPTVPDPTTPNPTVPGPTTPNPTVPGPTVPGPVTPNPTVPAPAAPVPAAPARPAQVGSGSGGAGSGELARTGTETTVLAPLALLLLAAGAGTLRLRSRHELARVSN